MSSSPLRRAQLIAPFGVGAMIVSRDGMSLIACGLDHWYKHESEGGRVDPSEFRVEEWRLRNMLKVEHFRQPPDFRKPRRGEDVPNCWLTVPFLRFPKWHYCTTCGRLYELPLTVREKVKCVECESKGWTRYLVQVPFVAVCEHGHIQDFPWREWVHKSVNPSCQKPMRLIGTGGATLAGQQVKCDCGEATRSMAGATTAYPDGNTYLTKHLDKNMQFVCQGQSPWHGLDERTGCGKPLRGALRNATNVYFSLVYSAIYLPRGDSTVPSELVSLLEEPPLSTFIKALSDSGGEIKPVDLRNISSLLLQPFTDEQIKAALEIILSDDSSVECDIESVIDEDSETAFRRQEFDVLRKERDEEQLRVRPVNLDNYDPSITRYFSRVMLVDKLRETRVLAGFRRVFPENEQTLEDMKALLWRDVPREDEIWLPACVVYGEGIFVELNETGLQAWIEKNRNDIYERLEPLIKRYQENQQNRGLRERPIGPRFLLLHTFAHLLMNQLTFECGYSSASLRERLYVSDNNQAPMAGILIYTAAGDSEGTLGGLVRMGKPGYLEPVIHRALKNARWCSADPVCMELGSWGGQGPNSCNLAACHNCALVPETTCEEFNMFLDRALVIGTHDNYKLGYFNGLF